MGGLFPLVNREKSVLLGTHPCYTTNTGPLTQLCFKWHPSKPLFFFFICHFCVSFLSSLSTTWTFFLSKVFPDHRGSHPLPPTWCIHSPNLDSAGFVTSCVACEGMGSLFIPEERAMLPKLRYFCLIRGGILRHSTFPYISWWLGQVFVSSMY